MDVDDKKLFIQNPKSGRQSEVVFIPKKGSDRLKDYIRSKGLDPEQRVFQIGYTAAREIVKKACQPVNNTALSGKSQRRGSHTVD